MMIALGLVVGLLTVRLLVMCGRDLLDAPILRRHNLRNRALPTAAGLLVVLAVLVVESGRATLGAFGLGDEPGRNLARPLEHYYRGRCNAPAARTAGRHSRH